MSEFHIDITIDKREALIVQNELKTFINEAGGLAIMVASDNDIEPSPELRVAIGKMFYKFLCNVAEGHFMEIQ
jgi:hypothetical protein